MSVSTTIRNAFILALAGGAAFATGARADETDYRICWSTLAAGGPYEGRTSATVYRILEDQQKSRERIKELKKEKLDIETETLQTFLGGENVFRNIDEEIRLEEDSQKRFSEAMGAVAKRECEYLRKRLPETTPQMHPPPRAPAGTNAALEMSAWPQPAAPYAPWTIVAPGQIEQHTAGYAGTYTWSTPPYHIGPEGFDLTLTALAQCEQGQRLSTGINLRGGFDFVKSAYDNTNVSTDLAAYCENNSDQKTLTVHVKPSRTYSAGQDVVIVIGAFYGPSVTYHYSPVRTGN